MRKQSTGFFALLVVGGYYAWRNRYQIQEFLERQGISLPVDTSGPLTDTVRSSFAKVRGIVGRNVDQISDNVSDLEPTANTG